LGYLAEVNLATRFECPTRIEVAVDEFLRFESPVQGRERIVTEDLRLGSEHLKWGDEVFLMLGEANPSARVLDGPTRFDVRRTPNPHIAFGWGSHFCLGSSLARM